MACWQTEIWVSEKAQKGPKEDCTKSTTATMELEKPNSLPPEKRPPEHLYHYTSIDGVEGIVGKRSLWASQIHFLNDTQEFRYSLDILKKVLSEVQKETPTGWIAAIELTDSQAKDTSLLTAFYKAVEEMVLHGLSEFFTKAPICVFSLSEKEDRLSQWRGYCPPAGGYSIGFHSERLIQFLKTRNLDIRPCVYNREEQEGLVKQMITQTGQILLKSSTNDPTKLQKAGEESLLQFFMEFSRIASILKHPSFDEEREWRIISGLIENKKMSFRVKKSLLIPYFEISFEGIEHFPIDEIIIGPTSEQSLVEFSLKQFVLRNSLKVSIKTSSIPYREL